MPLGMMQQRPGVAPQMSSGNMVPQMVGPMGQMGGLGANMGNLSGPGGTGRRRAVRPDYAHARQIFSPDNRCRRARHSRRKRSSKHGYNSSCHNNRMARPCPPTNRPPAAAGHGQP